MSEEAAPYGGKYPTEPSRELEPYFCWWMQELTARGIESKADIARELAKQSKEIDRLKAVNDYLERQIKWLVAPDFCLPPW
jgi:hypothetical protein